MLVAELIKDTQWLPGAGYRGARPRLSVLLPTFRRGADGAFLKAAMSVLEQSERDLELIIVDDGSTDGTAGQIESLMQADGRVSSLRHLDNIGLPAVSEYEALRRARAPLLAFAFDDFVFEPDALGRLADVAERRPDTVVYGMVEFHNLAGTVARLGEAGVGCERLAAANALGNAGVVVPRAVIDHVGFYDPHIAAARMCDWDLWRRIAREYPLFGEDVLVGREQGTLRGDSIGRTYPMYWEALQEYSNRARNTALRPENIERLDVWSLPPDCSACLAEHVLLTRRFLRSKTWTAGLANGADAARPLLTPRGRCIAVIANLHAGAPLCFDGLAERYGQSLLHVRMPISDTDLKRVLARSDAVIMLRYLLEDEAQPVVQWCHRMAIPLYHMIDDNFIVLGEEGYEAWRGYTRDRVVEALTGFAGVLCTSSSLAEYYRSLPLAASIGEMRPVFDVAKFRKLRRLAQARMTPGLRVGFIGGAHRARNLCEHVMPAMAAVAGDCPLEFFTRAMPETVPAEGLPFATTAMPSVPFDEFLTRWGEVGLDVLVHARADTGNTEYKTSSVLLSALYLGAVPIVPSEPPFGDVGEAEGVLKIEDDAASWERALRRVQPPDVRRELLSRLEVFCRSYFASACNEQALQRILDASTPTDLLTWAWRIRQAELG